MKQSAKRILSFVLCLAMVMGMLPAFAFGASAAGTLIDAAVFASDIHDGNSTLSSVMQGVAKSGLTYSSATFVGDSFSDSKGSVSAYTSTVQSALGSSVGVYYAYGSHDAGSDVEEDSYLIDSGNYYIYIISDADMRENAGATADAVAAEITEFQTAFEGMDKTKPLFIATHAPLHARRGDNTYANDWYTAIKAAAEEMDVAVFWAHNHTSESDVDRAAFYVAKDGTETIAVYNGPTEVPNFTYLNAGYIAPANNDTKRQGVATSVAIYDDSMTFTVYDAEGVYSGDYAVNETVTREFKAVEEAAYITGISVTTLPDKTVYDVGETLDTTGMVVTATYSDNTTAQVENWYTLNNLDMTTEGEKEVTVCYVDNGITFKTTFKITVEEQAAADAVLQSIEIISAPTKTEYLVSDALDITGMVVQATFSDGTVKTLEYAPFNDGEGYTVGGFCMYHEMDYEAVVSYTYGDVTCTDTFLVNVWEEDFSASDVSVHVTEIGITGITAGESENAHLETALADVLTDYVAYDIDLTFYEGYTTTNADATVTLPIPDGVDNPAVYYVSDDGITVTNMGAAKGDGVVTFTTDHFSTYVVGEGDLVPETATVPGYDGTSSKDVWKLTDTVTAGTYLIVNTNTAGSGYALLNNNGEVSAVAVTVVNDGTNTYIELDNANAEWTFAASGSDWLVSNNNSYLVHPDNSLDLDTSGVSWASSGANLYYNTTFIMWTVPYYLTGGSSWSVGTDEANVYFYTPTTITTGSSTVDATYGIDITVDGTASTEHSMVAVADKTLQLGYALTSDVDGQLPSGGSLSWSNKTSNGVANVDANGLVTFTGTVGQEVIMVSYTWTENGEEYTVTNYVVITATAPTYDIEISEDGTNASADLLAVRGVTATTTKQLSYLLTLDDGENVTSVTPASGITWSIVTGESDANVAAIDETGKLSFTGSDGTIKVKVSYKVDDNTTVEDIVTINVRKSNAVTPEESTTDFPRWGNPGSVRFDKTAQAVGNFSNTGIAQLELSMAGIPTGGGKPFDVVLMLDMSQSMNNSKRKDYTISAASAFLETICLDSDGNWNGLEHGISVCSYNIDPETNYPTTETNTSSAFTDDMVDITSKDIYTAADTAISKLSLGNGTDYAEALEHAYNILKATKDPDREQYLIFMTDGKPTSYAYIASSLVYSTDSHTESTIATGVYTEGDTTYNAYLVDQGTGTGSGYELDTTTLKNYDEYYSYLMKQDGVEIYTVGLAVEDDDSMTVLSHISSAADTETTTADNTHAFFITDGDSTALTNAFVQMGEEMMSAATNVNVTDQITDYYEMIFAWPSAVEDEDKVDGQEFYIEVVDYPLDDTTHERTGDSTILQRIYLDSTGTAIEKITYTDDSGAVVEQDIAPTFKEAAEGEDAYFNWTDTDGDGVADEGEYSYAPNGDGTHHMATGAYVELNGDGTLKSLHGIYFTYVVAEKKLYWTVTSMSEDSEIALRYFLYLTGSLESVAAGLQEGDEGYVAPDTYPTNVEASLNYTNYRNQECLQYFPEPQLTWNGAQVSYVFYLVNENGEPVNRAGRVVTFAEAVFVTDTYTEAVVWNEDEGVTELNATKVAQDLLPTDYTLYDPTTQYEIHVYQDADGSTISNWFTITAGGNTTMVYNTKAGTKYSAPGTYSSGDDAMSGFDFANTTVAFAVTWEKKLVEDTVVVDFGLPVNIDVVSNDFVYNYINGISASQPSYDINDGSPLNPDAYVPMSATELTIDGHKVTKKDENHIIFTPGSMVFDEPVKFYYETQVEAYEDGAVYTTYMYSSVTVVPATTIYYEDEYVTLTTYYAATDTDGNYIKDEYGNYTFSTTGTPGWDTNSVKATGTQAQDRPGAGKISADLDADNVYGYDAAYASMSQYSMGNAAMISVTETKKGEASFTFYGTGFDVISTTSNMTGTLLVKVYDAAGTNVKNTIVDTYYGYIQAPCKVTYTYDAETKSWSEKSVVQVDSLGESQTMPEEPVTGTEYYTYETRWVVSVNDPNALYQVPVMKISGLTYGQYTVKVVAAYNEFFDHQSDGGYDLYLDAIRIYDPTGNKNDTANAAYVADGEGWPIYKELRNLVITADTFGSDLTVNSVSVSTVPVSGVVFIDSNDSTSSISDYTSYGPNNELYLAAGQAVAFQISDAFTTADGADLEPVGVQLAVKTTGGTAELEIFNPTPSTTTTTADDGTETTTTTFGKGNLIDTTVNTATDMYLDITKLADGVIVISNPGESGIISITNIKFTFDQEAKIKTTTTTNEDGTEEVSEASVASISEEGAVYSLRSLRSYSVSETVEVETEPETEATEPETEATEPETEATEPETEATEPDTGESGDSETGDTVTEIVETIVEIIEKLFGWLFG